MDWICVANNPKCGGLFLVCSLCALKQIGVMLCILDGEMGLARGMQIGRGIYNLMASP